MACPVLGGKSIIHRLKSLPMDDGRAGAGRRVALWLRRCWQCR